MPNHDTPLPRQPQLEIIRTAVSERPGDELLEYRVYNFNVWDDGTVVRGDRNILGDLIWTVGLAIMYRWLEVDTALSQFWIDRNIEGRLAAWLILLTMFMYTKAQTVLYQSILAIPDIGVQLETARGLSIRLPFSDPFRKPNWVISKSSTFISLEQISTIVINEGLRRWRVEYYLAVVKKRGAGISVMFDVVRPPIAVLKEVLHGLRETLYDEHDIEPINVE